MRGYGMLVRRGGSGFSGRKSEAGAEVDERLWAGMVLSLSERTQETVQTVFYRRYEDCPPDLEIPEKISGPGRSGKRGRKVRSPSMILYALDGADGRRHEIRHSLYND